MACWRDTDGSLQCFFRIPWSSRKVAMLYALSWMTLQALRLHQSTDNGLLKVPDKLSKPHVFHFLCAFDIHLRLKDRLPFIAIISKDLLSPLLRCRCSRGSPSGRAGCVQKKTMVVLWFRHKIHTKKGAMNVCCLQVDFHVDFKPHSKVSFHLPFGRNVTKDFQRAPIAVGREDDSSALRRFRSSRSASCPSIRHHSGTSAGVQILGCCGKAQLSHKSIWRREY